MSDSYEISEELLADIRRIRRKVDGFNGPGITNTHDGLSFSIPDAPAPSAPVDSIDIIPLAVTGKATAGGAYLGADLRGTISFASSGSSGVTAPPTGLNTGTNYIVLNPPEYGFTNTSHCLGVTNRTVYGNGIVAGRTTDTPPIPLAVLLGYAPANCIFRVDLPGTAGGSAGGSNAFCSFTYSVRTEGTNGQSLSITGVPVDYRFIKCKMNPATNGLAYFDHTGAIKIAVAFETNDISSCT